MYFHIASSLLIDEHLIEINSILNFAKQGALFIKLGNNKEDAVDTWLKTRHRNEKATWENVINHSDKAQAKHRLSDKINVNMDGTGKSDWTANPPQLNLTDAVNLAGQAKRVILENSRADRNFILAMADDALRKRMLELEANGRLIFFHAGGNGELKMQLEGTHIPLQGSRYFCWVLIDSDAPIPGAISDPAKRIIDLCDKSNIRRYCLNRRAIENYLPRQAMIDAVSEGVLDNKVNEPQIEAFFKLTTSQRHHFHMKKGLDDHSCKNSNQYDPAKDPNIKAIQHGFGDKISKIYNCDEKKLPILYKLFAADGATSEMSSPFNELKSMIRGLT